MGVDKVISKLKQSSVTIMMGDDDCRLAVEQNGLEEMLQWSCQLLLGRAAIKMTRDTFSVKSDELVPTCLQEALAMSGVFPVCF